jgi:pimeloyl-ACP methyl ester carboxylesterase
MRSAIGLGARLSGLLLVMLLGVGPAAARESAIDWQPCSNAPGFQCGQLVVPLDYAHPRGTQISLALIEHPATDPAARVGALLFNSGGPGGAGTADLPLFLPFFSSDIQARFDIVSFDPRGIGGSDQLRCFATPGLENLLLSRLPAAGFPFTSAEVQQEISVYARFDRACARNGGPIQYHMDTADVARDMDRIRAALGESRLDYYGPSYGSYLGAVYANLFPSNVGRLVLDGDVPPVAWNDSVTGARLNTFSRIQSALGTQTALRMMLDDCGAVDVTRCAFSAGTPQETEQKYETLAQQVKLTPVTVDGQDYTYPLLLDADQAGLFTQNADSLSSGWSALAQLLQALWTASTSPTHTALALPVQQSAAPLLGLSPFATLPGSRFPGAEPPFATPTSGTAAQFSPELPEGTDGVLCSESPNPTDPTSYQPQAQYTNLTQSPDGFGYGWTWVAEPCAQWQARDSDRYNGPWNRSPVPLLVIGTLGDPNTSYTGAVSMTSVLGNARLLTETGGGHTALINTSDCVNAYVGDYLINGTLPPPGTVCNQNQPPF